MIRLIIYDLDGTLIDSRLDIADAVNWTLKELGLLGAAERSSLPVEQISGFIGNGVRNLMKQALGTVLPRTTGTVLEPSLERSIKLFRRRYGEHLLDETKLYPSVRKVLEFFRDRKQAVLTNKPEEFSLEILRGLQIDSYFFRVIGGGRGLPKKPAPEPVREILRSAEVRPEEAILVGDSALDIETGRNAGVKTAAVTCGFGRREEIKRAGPDFILEDLEELMQCPLLKT